MRDYLGEILKLSVSERIILVQAIWDSVAAEPEENITLSNSQKEELDRRLEQDRKGEMTYSNWSDVKKRVRLAR